MRLRQTPRRSSLPSASWTSRFAFFRSRCVLRPRHPSAICDQLCPMRKTEWPRRWRAAPGFMRASKTSTTTWPRSKRLRSSRKTPLPPQRTKSGRPSQASLRTSMSLSNRVRRSGPISGAAPPRHLETNRHCRHRRYCRYARRRSQCIGRMVEHDMAHGSRGLGQPAVSEHGMPRCAAVRHRRPPAMPHGAGKALRIRPGESVRPSPRAMSIAAVRRPEPAPVVEPALRQRLFAVLVVNSACPGAVAWRQRLAGESRAGDASARIGTSAGGRAGAAQAAADRRAGGERRLSGHRRLAAAACRREPRR